MIGYVVLLTFFLSAGHTQELKVKCPDMACVERVRAAEPESILLSRLRVWREDEFVLLPVSDKPINPPIIDDQRS